MNQKIYGDPDTINLVKNARPGDPHVYINMEAIAELPDQYEVHFNKVTFDPKNDFDDVGGSYMPSPRVMNDIAEARGIEGTNDIKIESIIEEIDINPLLCKPLGSEPTIRKTIVGKRAVKTGRVLNEDGTWRTSDPCTVDFNAWERCLIEWTKEEEATNGYDPQIVKNGPYEYFKKKYNGQYYQKGQYAYPIKYISPYTRQRHFAEMMKFAQRQADTKARHIVIRVLAGLKTGYTEEEIKDGYFIFAKIRRSRQILQLETAADLQARAQGITSRGDNAQAMLFGPSDNAEPAITIVEEEWPTHETQSDPEPVPTRRDLLIGIFEEYKKNNFITGDKIGKVDACLKWLNDTMNAEDDVTFWKKSVGILKEIEETIPVDMRMRHSLY